MKKNVYRILLVMGLAVFLTACKNKPAKESEIEVTKSENQEKLQEEELNTEISFPGGVLDDSDFSEETVEENTKDTASNSEKIASDEKKDTEENVTEKEDSSVKEDKPAKEDTYDGDLVEVPMKNSAGVI